MSKSDDDVLPGQSSIFDCFGDDGVQVEPAADAQEACTIDRRDAEEQDVVVEQQESDDEFLTMNDGQLSFVDPDEWWKEHWKGMHEFVQGNTEPWKTVCVHLRSREDMKILETVLEQRLSEKTKSVWFPAHERVNRICMGYVEEA